MIDITELSLDWIYDATNPIANSNDIALTLLQITSDPEVYDKLYENFTVVPQGIGVCGTGYCNIIDQVYYVSDNNGGTDGIYCAEHAAAGIYNAMTNRIRHDLLWSERSYLEDVYHIMRMYDHYLQPLLTGSTKWPKIEQQYDVCFTCQRALLPAGKLNGRQGYNEVVGLDSNGQQQRMHAACVFTCDCCDNTYANAQYAWRYRNDRNTDGLLRARQVYSNIRSIEGGQWCDKCIDEYSNHNDYDMQVCANCADFVIGRSNRDVLTYSEIHGEYVCSGCYENGLDCDRCGYTIYNGEDHYCEDNDEEEETGIHHYGYKPRPIFYGEPPRMGFELEVECTDGSRSDGIDIINAIDPYEKRYYLKSDGSLSYGFEVVSHPHSLEEYHKLDWSWLDALGREGFRSWNTSSCGLHVHIGLDGFKDEKHQIRFTKFIYDNERQAKRIAGRSSSYAAFDDKGRAIPKIKYKHNDSNRYSAVNVQNEHTLEVRIFRGSLRKERVLSGIEFTHAVCEYTRDMKIVPKNKPFSWLRFAAYVAANDVRYPNLFTIINETFERRTEIDNQQDGE